MMQWAISKPYRVTFADGTVARLTAYGPSEAAEQAAIEFHDGAVVRIEPDAPLEAGQLYVGVEGFGRLMGLAGDAARRRIAELEARGLRRHGNGRGSRFRISEIIELQDKLANKRG
jgi:hypothetical protein